MRYKAKTIHSWSPDMAYVVGLITSDGSLSKDNRHIDFTSKDLELVKLYRSIIKQGAKIGIKHSGKGFPYYRVQLGDVAFYDFLIAAGLLPNKSKLLKAIKVPDNLFPDFLRGCFDGDGCVYGVVDKRWKNSYMYYASFVSASPFFLRWLHTSIRQHMPNLTGHIRAGGLSVEVLTFAKANSRELFNFMYYNDDIPCLSRKKDKFLEVFARNPYP